MSNINPCPSNSTWDQNSGLGFGLIPFGSFYHSAPAPPCASISIIFPCIMLSAGLSGNILAFATVYRSYRQPESQRKRPFLVLVGALAMTDLTGQLITAPLVIAVYAVGRRWSRIDPTGVLCQFFGACMTTFGLIPLFLASLMALERATAVRRPLVYVRRPPSPSQAGHAVVMVWLVAVSLACGPFFLGGYGLQWPGTWCFLRTKTLEPVQLYPAGIFVLLALVSLFTTGACNAVTAHGLLSRKLCLRTEMERRSSGGTGTDASRFAIEPAAHLLGIMAVLGVCWLPLLVVMIKEIVENLQHHAPSTVGCNISNIHNANISKEMIFNMTLPSAAMTTTTISINDLNRCRFYLPAIRLASLNQILDPWVYLLFRNIVMRRVHRVICSCCHCGLGQSRLTPPGSTGAEDLRSGETE